MEELVAGIDEAGRGPVIGPMIVAGVVLRLDDLQLLAGEGVADSKTLTPRQREELASRIREKALHIVVVEVPPELIDTVNLNLLELDTFTYIASRLCSRWRLRELVVDSVGSPEKTASRLARVCRGPRVVARHHADRDYTVVAAASILAKTVRDAIIRRYHEMYGDFGSGYPTDPRTLEWIQEAYSKNPREPPPIVRRTWGLLRRLAPSWHRAKGRSGGQRSLLDYLGHTGD